MIRLLVAALLLCALPGMARMDSVIVIRDTACDDVIVHYPDGSIRKGFPWLWRNLMEKDFELIRIVEDVREDIRDDLATHSKSVVLEKGTAYTFGVVKSTTPIMSDAARIDSLEAKLARAHVVAVVDYKVVPCPLSLTYAGSRRLVRVDTLDIGAVVDTCWETFTRYKISFEPEE